MPIISRRKDRGPATPSDSGSIASLFPPGRHIPAIDGLRGIAVLMVVVFHIFQAEPPIAGAFTRAISMSSRLGQTGVDLFFVLSGFLITGILVDAKGSPRYFINFYGRRTVRIFPLYYGILIAVLVILPAAFGIRVKSVDPIWLWTYTSNIPLAFGAEGGAFGYFWTLAIEEQFYLFWPAVVYFADRATLSKICVGCIVGALIARIVVEASGNSSFSFTLCRMDSLTVGALLALIVRGPSRIADARRMALAVLAGTAVVAAPLYLLKTGDGSHWVQVIKFTMIAAFYGATLLLVVTSPAGSKIGRILTAGPLRTMGKYSYGIYVYQGFVISAASTMLATDRLRPMGISGAGALWIRVASVLVLTFIAAWISWHAMEKHFIHLKKYFSNDVAGGAISARLARARRRIVPGNRGADAPGALTSP